jgi:hypothetical protein
MENQVAEDSCANDVRFQVVSDLCLEAEANPVCTECVGFQLSHYRAIDGRDIGGREMDTRKLRRLLRHDDGKGSRSAAKSARFTDDPRACRECECSTILGQSLL